MHGMPVFNKDCAAVHACKADSRMASNFVRPGVLKGALYMRALDVSLSSQAKSVQQRDLEAGTAESLMGALLMLAGRR